MSATSSNLDESKILSSAKGLDESLNEGFLYRREGRWYLFNYFFSFPHNVSTDTFIYGLERICTFCFRDL